MNTTVNSHGDDDRPAAVVAAEIGADGWTEVARPQKWATPDHADFYQYQAHAPALVRGGGVSGGVTWCECAEGEV